MGGGGGKIYRKGYTESFCLQLKANDIDLEGGKHGKFKCVKKKMTGTLITETHYNYIFWSKFATTF